MFLSLANECKKTKSIQVKYPKLGGKYNDIIEASKNLIKPQSL